MKQIIKGFLRIGKQDPKLFAALRDLFAAGCYLILNGKADAGRRMCRAAFRAAGIRSGTVRFNKDVSLNLDSKNRRLILELAMKVKPHVEVSDDLFGSIY